MFLKDIKIALPLLAIALFATCDLPKVDDLNCDLVPRFTFPGDTLVELGDTLQFADASTGSGTVTYAWFFGDGHIGSLSEKSPIHIFSKIGEFEIRLTLSNPDCQSESFVRTFNVRDTTVLPPVAKIMIMVTSGEVPWTAVFKNNSTGQFFEQEWDFGDGSAKDPAFEPSHIYQTADTFRVILKVTGPGGVDRDTVFVEAKAKTFIKTFPWTSGNAQETARLVAENPSGGFWVATNDNSKTVTTSVVANGSSSQVLDTYDLGTGFSAEFARYGIADANGFSFTGVAHYDPGGADGDDFYLLRLNNNFSLQTLQTIYDDVNDGNEVGYGIAPSINGGFVVCGRKSSVGTNLGMYFTELLPNGTINRVAQFTTDKNNTAHGIVQKNGGGYAVIGRMLNGTDFNACFFTLNSSLSNPSLPVFFGNTTPTDLVRIPTGGYLMLLRDGSSGKLLKLLDSGVKDWELTLPDMTVQRLVLTSDGNAAVVGWQTAGASSGAKLVKVRLLQKDIAWQHNYLKSNYLREGYCLVQLSDNGFLLGGSEKDAAGIYRTLLIRTDATGEAQE